MSRSSEQGRGALLSDTIELIAPERPPRVQQAAAVQLGVVAAQFAVVLVAGWCGMKLTVGGEELLAGDIAALRARGALGSLGDLVTLLTVLGALGLFLRTRKDPGSVNVLRASAILHVGAAFGVACAELWGPWPPDLLPRGVTYASVWIAIFPLVVPTSFQRALVTSALAASMVPIALVLSVLLGPNEWPTLGVAAALIGPTFVIAALACFPGSALHRLQEEVELARRVGSYHLVQKLGEGGMGEVWRASHQMLVRPAAIKLVRSERMGTVAGAEHALIRFEREAQATAALVSPHTVRLFDFGRTEDGDFYYVMELLDGLDLQTLVEEYGPVPPARVAYLLAQVCHSLEEAHQRGLVHRDIKPANLFLCRYGLDADFVKVLDFGLVHSEDPDHGLEVTAVGAVSGTAAYMAPERVDGHSGEPGVDIYALGCVAYWLLTGRLVFKVPTPMHQLLSHSRDTPDPPSRHSEFELPPAFEDLILRCLDKAPHRRPASAAAMARELGAMEFDAPWGPEQADVWWDEVHPPSEG